MCTHVVGQGDPGAFGLPGAVPVCGLETSWYKDGTGMEEKEQLCHRQHILVQKSKV